MLPFLFRKRIEHQGKTEEDGLLDLEIKRALQAEYGNAEPPAGIFDKVMYAIKQRRRRDEAKSYTNVFAYIFLVLRALYAQTRKAKTLVAINRLAPAGVALALLVVFADANVQHMLGRHTSPPPSYNIVQGTPAPNAAPVSRVNIADAAVEADPRILPFPPARVASVGNPAEAGERASNPTSTNANGSPRTDNQDTYLEDELHLNFGRPY